MPWKVKSEGGQYCVVKKADGSTVKCHSDKASATAHVRALYANESKEDPEGTVEKEFAEKGYYGYSGTYVPWNVTSFQQLDAAQAQREKIDALYSLGDQFQQIASNILYDSEVENKGAALQALVSEYSQRVDEEATANKSLADRFRSLWSKPEPKSAPDTSFLIWKEESTGRLRWLGLYTNNCEDNQGDIIEKEAHETFVDLVDEGIVEQPELWYWHIPALKMGTTDWLAESDGFVLASGLIDKEMEEFASMIPKTGVPHRMSHGMVKRLLVRDADNPSHIKFYVSKELTALPEWAAANSRTDFAVLVKEETMLSDTKKTFLREKFGFDDAKIKEFEDYTAGKSQEADAAGVQRKEGDAPPAAEAAPAATPTYVTAEEVAGVVASALKPLINAMTEIGASVGEMQSEMKELRVADSTRIAKAAESVPAASLEALLAEKLFGAGSLEKGTGGARTFAKPREAAVEVAGGTGISFIDELIQKSQEYDPGY